MCLEKRHLFCARRIHPETARIAHSIREPRDQTATCLVVIVVRLLRDDSLKVQLAQHRAGDRVAKHVVRPTTNGNVDSMWKERRTFSRSASLSDFVWVDACLQGLLWSGLPS